MNHSLLIVDDDVNQLSALACWFRQRGYRVVATDHPKKALIAARGQPFQAALVDASLPEIDGLELTCRLRRMQHELPVILLSGYDLAECVSRESSFHAEGVFAFLRKPCNLALLDATVNDAIDWGADDALCEVVERSAS